MPLTCQVNYEVDLVKSLSMRIKITFQFFSFLAKLCIFQGQVPIFRTYLTHQHFFMFKRSIAIINLHGFTPVAFD